MSDRPSPAKTRLALLALTLAVLLVHAWLLQAAPKALGGGQGAGAMQEAPMSFVTRTVVMAPTAAPSASPPVASSTPRPAKVAQTPRPASPPAPPPPADQPSQASVAPAFDAADAPADVAPLAAADATAPEADDVVTEAQATTGALAQAASPLPPGAKVPASQRLKYAVTANKFPFSLNAELLWQHDSTSYNARLAFSAFGQSRVQISQGDLDSQGLAPTRFSDKFRTELAAHFNRTLGKITFSANTPDAALMAGAQDRLSVLVQLATLIASDPGSYPQATTITVQTAGPREASPWLFTVQAPETLMLPGGEQATLKLVRLPRRDFDQKVELWLAPALGYLPARIRITEHNGDYIDQQWLTSEALQQP